MIIIIMLLLVSCAGYAHEVAACFSRATASKTIPWHCTEANSTQPLLQNLGAIPCSICNKPIKFQH